MKLRFFTVFMIAAATLMAACGKSDGDLTKAVTDKLAADKVTGVTASVKDGVATLSGEVADVTVKSKAEASAKGVEGVKSVTNNITLKALPAAQAPDSGDQMLQGTINENLKKAGVTTVMATVSDGNVTLTGTVTSTADLAKANEAAMSTHPKHVDNKVEVKK